MTDEKEYEVKKVPRSQRYWIKELDLFMSDRWSIRAGEWLTDAVINCSQKLLKQSYPLMGGLQSTGLGNTLTYDIEKDQFIQIFNIRGNHWVTISNIGCAANNYTVYDSIPYGDVSSRVKEQLCALIFSESKQIALNFPQLQCQRGGGDCGLFAIAFATSLCTGLDPTDLKYEQHYLRDHLLNCIKKKSITPFPCTLNMKKNTLPIHQQVVSLHCMCRQPEKGRMAQCDQCHEWYHEECVTLPKNIESVTWFCPNCK